MTVLLEYIYLLLLDTVVQIICMLTVLLEYIDLLPKRFLSCWHCA